jgi:hypothetical protein
MHEITGESLRYHIPKSSLDFHGLIGFISSYLARERRRPEAFAWRSGMRRLRAGSQASTRAVPGHTQTSLRSLRHANCYAGTIMSPCQQLADRRFLSLG